MPQHNKPLSQEELKILFTQAALKRSMTPAIVEKDYWVCWTLQRLFSSDPLQQKLLFKGGTSLSKVFKVIQRFSEDIDLILDWNEVTNVDPHAVRSKTKQDRFNKEVVEQSREYIAETLLPEVQQLIQPVCTAKIEDGAPDVINIQYPAAFTDAYLHSEIRLEIGPLAQWVPNAQYTIQSYVSEAYSKVIAEPPINVRAIKAERTFWEKTTILHQEAFRPPSNPQPPRYSRHYYDLAMMAESDIRQTALNNLDLLASVVAFKQKFYPRAWAHYELAKPGSLKLLPGDEQRRTLKDDYRKMQAMLFGERPEFDQIITVLQELEREINRA